MEFSLFSNTQNQNITVKKGLSLTALSLFLQRSNCANVPIDVIGIDELDCSDFVILSVSVPCIDIGVWQMSISDGTDTQYFKCNINAERKPVIANRKPKPLPFVVTKQMWDAMLLRVADIETRNKNLQFENQLLWTEIAKVEKIFSKMQEAGWLEPEPPN